jgi:putative SOS response-associated peptidase YedK
MCGRFILVQKLEAIEKRFNVKASFDIELLPSYNVAPGNYAPVITSQDPRTLQLMRFGMVPSWSKSDKMMINARSEGDHNSADDPNYKGAKGIIEKPSFRKPIRSQRCLVIADAFIEGTTKEKLSKPFLVYLRNKVRPFAMAGIYDIWKNPDTGAEIHAFAIITTVANELLQKIPHHRSPVILSPHQEGKWLNQEAPLSDITAMLRPYKADLMNAYPISPQIKSPTANNPQLIQPLGPPLLAEDAFVVTNYLMKTGMGNPKGHFTDQNPSDKLK